MDPRERNELAWLLTVLVSSESPDLTLTFSPDLTRSFSFLLLLWIVLRVLALLEKEEDVGGLDRMGLA